MVLHKSAQIYFSLPPGPYHSETFSSGFAPLNSGSWHLDVWKDDGVVQLSWENVSSRVCMDLVELAGSAGVRVAGPERAVTPGAKFPPSPAGRLQFDLSGNPRPTWLRIEFNFGTLVEESKPRLPSLPPLPAPGPASSKEAKSLARRNTILLSTHAPNDVVFYFPRSNLELWANSKILTKGSPYLGDLLKSGFKEATGSAGEAYRAELSDFDQPDWDSDDEADKVSAPLRTTRTEWVLPSGVKEIVVKSTAYTTYHAVLAWIHFGFIQFAPLSSNTLGPTTNEPQPKRARLDAPAKYDPALALPASPKSVYALAHLLQLPELTKLALDDFKSKLTVQNVLYQLASEVAVHDEVRAAVFKFAKANWDAVKASKALAEMSRPEVMQALGTEFGARLAELVMKC